LDFVEGLAFVVLAYQFVLQQFLQAREIREYFILDFSNWLDHGSYQRAFRRLVHDLDAEAVARTPGTATDSA